jgi:hypothetical protein
MFTVATIERIERERELALPGRERAVEADAWNTITRLIRVERRAIHDRRRRAITVRLLGRGRHCL